MRQNSETFPKRITTMLSYIFTSNLSQSHWLSFSFPFLPGLWLRLGPSRWLHGRSFFTLGSTCSSKVERPGSHTLRDRWTLWLRLRLTLWYATSKSEEPRDFLQWDNSIPELLGVFVEDTLANYHSSIKMKLLPTIECFLKWKSLPMIRCTLWTWF